MRTNELTSEAAKRIRGAMTPAASLIMILLLTAWGLILASRAISLLIGSLFFEAAAEEMLSSALSAAVGIVGFLLICDPLWLNARRWFFRLDEGYVPLRAAFYYVSSVARYRQAMCFTLILTAIRFLVSLLCFLPAAVVWAAVCIVETADVYTLLAVILDAVLLLLGIVFSYYLLSGLFLTEYLFITGQEIKVFAAVKRSFRLMHGSRSRLFKLLCNLIPYFLISFAVVTLPLTIPHIESCFAVLAKQLLAENKSDAREAPDGQHGGEYVFTE